MKKHFLWIIAPFFLVSKAYAVCPICTIAVGSGLILSEKFGIDDTISGLWIGGLTVSMIAWTINWFNKKNFHFKGRIITTTILYYALVVAPLYFMPNLKESVWHPLNTFWGMNKLLLGIIIGSIVFFVATLSYESLKKKNNGKAHFPFEKIVFPVGSLAIFSTLFYFLTK